jgi:hypothetical protein
VFLSSGREALVPKTRPTFKGWTGAFTGSTYGGKPLLDFDGQALFAELVILRLFQRDGWDGVWVDKSTYRTSMMEHSRVALPPDKERLLQDIYHRAGARAGCFDVLCWKDEWVVFAESKRRSKDWLQPTQRRWIEAALGVGVPLKSLLIVEWELRVQGGG